MKNAARTADPVQIRWRVEAMNGSVRPKLSRRGRSSPLDPGRARRESKHLSAGAMNAVCVRTAVFAFSVRFGKFNRSLVAVGPSLPCVKRRFQQGEQLCQ
jgi:hypothetical protein